MADRGQALVLHPPVRDGVAASVGPGDGGRARVGLERAGVGEPDAVVAHLAEQPGSGQVSQSGETRDDLEAGVPPPEMWDWYGPYTEVVSGSAFDETLARVDLDVPLVLAHDQLRRIARTTLGTLDLTSGGDGLAVAARLDVADADVAYIMPKLRAGLVDEMSFAFRIEAGTWSPDYTEYRIDRVDLHRGDVAIVGYGANPYTDAGLRTRPPASSRARALLELALAR